MSSFALAQAYYGKAAAVQVSQYYHCPLDIRIKTNYEILKFYQ